MSIKSPPARVASHTDRRFVLYIEAMMMISLLVCQKVVKQSHVGCGMLFIVALIIGNISSSSEPHQVD